jgi:hypothetical protein
MVFDDIEQAKLFVEWAKSQQIKKVELGELKVEFHDLAFINDIEKAIAPAPVPLSPEAQKVAEAVQAKEEEDLLFWSVK